MDEIVPALSAVAIGLTVIAGVAATQFNFLSYFSPKYEEVRKNTFEKSATYREGLVRDIMNAQTELLQTKDPEVRAGLITVNRHKFLAMNTTVLTTAEEQVLKQITTPENN